MTATLREASKAVYNANERPTHEDLRTGCLQRIADATELVAKRHMELIEESARYKRWYEQESATAKRLVRSNNALRGQITKLKRKAVVA